MGVGDFKHKVLDVVRRKIILKMGIDSKEENGKKPCCIQWPAAVIYLELHPGGFGKNNLSRSF
jgi:hypothetical protein